MPSAIEEVRDLLNLLPDNSSFEDIQYHIYVREKIRQGIEQADRGELIDQVEVEKRMAKWTAE